MAENAYHKLRTVRPPIPVGCPVNHAFSPFAEAYLANPYPQLATLRETSPVFYAEQLGYLVVTRMEEVVEVFRNPDIYSSENVQDPVLPICDAAAEILDAPDYNPVAVMSNRSRPDHTRIRKYTQAGFSSRRMSLLAPFISERCVALVDSMIEHGAPVDFVQALAHPLPGETIFRFIGFPEADDNQLKRWTTNRLAFTWGKAGEAEQVAIAEKMLAYWRYCVAFVETRMSQPADDFTSELLSAHAENPDDLSLDEVKSIVYGLSFAGHEIVSNLLSNLLLQLLLDRNRWLQVCADPALIPGAIDELLRYDSPQTSWRRVTVTDTELGGINIPAGTQVFMSLGAANHDEALFENSEQFDLNRPNANDHISFGRGIHFCLGNRLAILEATITLETLTARLPTLALVADQRQEYAANCTFRGPKALLLTWA